MKVLKRYEVPTGKICVVEGSKGPIEFLSIGDYGKDINLNKPITVGDNLPILPLTDKWVITISTQYGCSMGCSFCDVPAVGAGKNCTLNDMQQQVLMGLLEFPEVQYSNRLNIHYARMGEPTWNPAVLDHAKWMKEHIDPEYNVHPVLTTMLPKKNEWLKTMLHGWIRIKNRVYRGNAGLQLSINGTNEAERKIMFHNNALPLDQIARLFDGAIPVGRKFTLNFPICGWEIDPDVLLKYFNPEHFIVKLTPMHETKAAEDHGHKTEGDYTNPNTYKDLAESIRKAGYECLVFIASADEDLGRITCGNAVLSLEKTGKDIRQRSGPLNWIGGSPIGKTPHTSWGYQPDPYHTDLVESNIGFAEAL
jgi:23S rRNA (adenine2503-C2)-methyltransferase